jgi:hypothetical protein
LSDEENPNREKARLARARQQAISKELRRIYDQVVQEPVPDEFMELVRKLDSTEKIPPEKSSS